MRMFLLTLVPVVSLFVIQIALAEEVPFPHPSHEGLRVEELGTVKDFKLSLWLQHRVMYNSSNIPGSPDLSFSETKTCEFFRQRLRVGVDVRTTENVGGYFQLEYRGGWGGSSPTSSDPRGTSPAINSFNRLQARGLRYGFLYANMDDRFNLAAGILPLTDRVGRVLFDADWDFNIGGLMFWGSLPAGDYRFAYARLVEGIGGMSSVCDDVNEDLIIVDYCPPLKSSIDIGVHLYSLLVPSGSVSPLASMTDNQTWFGVTARKEIDKFDINGMVLLNSGKINDDSHFGVALGVGTGFPIGPVNVDALFMRTSGDPEGETDNRFVTLHQLMGTEGYWGYTHIFNANGPSDLNDLGLEIGNGNAGLLTFQARATCPLNDKFDLQLTGGFFQASESRNSSTDMGKEISAAVTAKLADYMALDLGLAHAFMGDFYATGAEDLTELFSRFQFAW